MEIKLGDSTSVQTGPNIKEKIIECLKEWDTLFDGMPSQRSVAKQTGISRTTVHNHWDDDCEKCLVHSKKKGLAQMAQNSSKNSSKVAQVAQVGYVAAQGQYRSSIYNKPVCNAINGNMNDVITNSDEITPCGGMVIGYNYKGICRVDITISIADIKRFRRVVNHLVTEYGVRDGQTTLNPYKLGILDEYSRFFKDKYKFNYLCDQKIQSLKP